MGYILLAILTIAALALFWGGYQQSKRGDQTKAMLMFIAGLVALGNVLVWVVPV